jgi:hypothetical protein
LNIHRLVLALSAVAAALALFGGSALANNSDNSAMKCGGTGLNPGQAFQLTGLAGGPAAGPDRTQTPPDFAALLGADSVGALLQRDCTQVH